MEKDPNTQEIPQKTPVMSQETPKISKETQNVPKMKQESIEEKIKLSFSKDHIGQFIGPKGVSIKKVIEKTRNQMKLNHDLSKISCSIIHDTNDGNVYAIIKSLKSQNNKALKKNILTYEKSFLRKLEQRSLSKFVFKTSMEHYIIPKFIGKEFVPNYFFGTTPSLIRWNNRVRPIPNISGQCSEQRKEPVMLGWALTFLVPFLFIFGYHETIYHVMHVLLLEYIPFIILLLSLYTISGGIRIRGTLIGTPILNVALIFIGTVLASWMGTTGAAMLLIRPI